MAHANDLDLILKTEWILRKLSYPWFRWEKIWAVDKTKYMVTGKSTISSCTISVEYLDVQKLESFVYLGTMVNSDGGVMIKIQARKGAVNKCYFGLMKHLMSKLLSHKVKCLIYKTLIRPVLRDLVYR
jgi:hypothetical protein